MSQLEREEQIGGALVLLQRCCQDAEKTIASVDSSFREVGRVVYGSQLADLREAILRAKQAGAFWLPPEETVALRRWIDRASALAETIEAALRLVTDDKQEVGQPNDEGFWVDP